MNLRPPGPQPGALPDCATPRGFKQAGDGNRTRPRSLEGFCATTTLRPQAVVGDRIDRWRPGRESASAVDGARTGCLNGRTGPDDIVGVVSGGGARLFSMPLGPLGVTGLLAALDWGAWEWAAANNHSTVGLIAGLLMAPIAVAFAWSLIRVLIALAVAPVARPCGALARRRRG